MNGLRSLVVGLALAGLSAAPSAATMVLDSNLIQLTKDSVGSQYLIKYNGIVDKNVQSGLASTMLLTLNSVSDSNRLWTFTVSLTNTSQAPITQARISGFGMGLQGYDKKGDEIDIEGASASPAKGGPEKILFGQVLDEDELGENLQIAQLGKIADVCFMAGSGTAKNCNGGGGGGLAMAAKGQDFPMTSQVIALSFEEGLWQLDLFDLFVRYQSIGGSKFGTSGVGQGIVDDGADPIPEPASWAMLIAGFGLTGAAMRRRRVVAA